MLYKLGSGSRAGLAGAALLVIIASCQSHTHTSSSKPTAPLLGSRPVRLGRWCGGRSGSSKSLKTWLLKQRIPLVDDVKFSQLASEKGFHLPLSNPDVLKLAKSPGPVK